MLWTNQAERICLVNTLKLVQRDRCDGIVEGDVGTRNKSGIDMVMVNEEREREKWKEAWDPGDMRLVFRCGTPGFGGGLGFILSAYFFTEFRRSERLTQSQTRSRAQPLCYTRASVLDPGT